MKTNHQVFQHLPMLNFQLLIEKNTQKLSEDTNLKIFVDSDEDDLNRTLMDINLEAPHFYNLSLTFEGFDCFTSGSENEKFISGKVFLTCKSNELAKTHCNTHDATVSDKIIELANPKLIVLPIKAATAKHPAIWPSPADISRQIRSNWLDVFSNALSGYFVQSYNLYNAETIAASCEAANLQQAKFSGSSNNANSVAISPSTLGGTSFLAKLNKKEKRFAMAIGGYVLLLSFVLLASLTKSFFFSENQIQPQLANNNFQIPTNVMSVEEAKKAQLRELGINPDDLAADLGCFVEEN